VVRGDHPDEGGIRAGRRLVASGDLPTAVVSSNDRLAVGVMDAFLRAGIDVPADVSIVGYDDSTLAHLAHIDLTTVNQDAPAQARHAVLAAVTRLDRGRTVRQEMVLVPRLVVRGSTAPPLTAHRSSKEDGMTDRQPAGPGEGVAGEGVAGEGVAGEGVAGEGVAGEGRDGMTKEADS
jgi:hypothetical protein